MDWFEEETKTEYWEKAIEGALEKLERELARPGARMHEFASQAAQGDREMREEMV